MKYKLKVFGRADLDGSHRAIIETKSAEFESLRNTLNQTTTFLKLQNSSKTCGCILSEIKHGNANRLWLDHFKQRHLLAKDGDLVSFEEIQLPAAKKIKLLVPPDYSERDTVRLIGKPVSQGEKTAVYSFSGKPRIIIIADTLPNEVVLINSTTSVETSMTEPEEVPIIYQDIGGLDKEIKIIRENIEFPLRFPDVFEHLGISQPRGIILYGPPGTGKTLIARALATEVGAKFYSISGPEIYSMWYGESERKLREIFDEARKHSPAVILIDELDALIPKRDEVRGEVEKRVVATLLTLMDGLKHLKGVVVVGTTNRINSIDIAFRREGRFGHEIHIGIPDSSGRKEILEINTQRMPLSSDVNLEIIAERTVGFVGADITGLCREAAFNALRRSFSPEAFEKGKIIPHGDLEIHQSDFESALPNITPSGLKEFIIEIPKVTWDDIGGLDEVKKLLIENIAFNISKREIFKKVNVKPAKGILLYGPPGTGKTLLAKAVANQCNANFISVKGPEIRSKWLGESEERIRFLFSKAREVAPCVIFFDEIDSAAPIRGRNASDTSDTIVNQILVEMDGIESAEGVVVLGATNRVELLDPALLRPGRFDYHIEVPLPDAIARNAIFNTHLKGKPLSTDIIMDELVQLTDGFSGAEIAEICRQGAWEAIRDVKYNVKKVKVTMNHLKKALLLIRQTREKLNPKPIGFLTPEGDGR